MGVHRHPPRGGHAFVEIELFDEDPAVTLNLSGAKAIVVAFERALMYFIHLPLE
jgi:hypothetical protein